MRVGIILLYLLSLIPYFDVCASNECVAGSKSTHDLLQVSILDECCSHEASSCAVGTHEHSLERCNHSKFITIRPERESLRRAPLHVGLPGFKLLFSDAPFRAPPLFVSTSNSTHNSYQIKVVTTSVIRC